MEQTGDGTNEEGEKGATRGKKIGEKQIGQREETGSSTEIERTNSY